MSDRAPDVLVERHDSILRLQINRPQKKNALTPDMFDALREGLAAADADPSIHVVYLTGSGNSFCAGIDLNTFLHDSESEAPRRFLKAVSITETPVVAAVNGLAVGVGVTMLLHCDLVYVAETATFDFAFVDLGVVPEAGSSFLLPRMVGQRRAAELLMLGGRFNALDAVAHGIANAAVVPDELEAVSWEAAAGLAAKPPEALRQTKMLLKRGTAAAVAEAIAVEGEILWQRVRSDEARAIMEAILKKRNRPTG